MKRIIQTTMIAVMLLACVSLFAGDISIGIRIGAPPRPRVLRVIPRRPGPDYLWIEGYWYPVGNHYQWHQGYWTLPPYTGARWVMPHYDGHLYFQGFWEGDRGRIAHDYRWDRYPDRDFHYAQEHKKNGNHHEKGKKEARKHR
jgi:hypothetical protein